MVTVQGPVSTQDHLKRQSWFQPQGHTPNSSDCALGVLSGLSSLEPLRSVSTSGEVDNDVKYQPLPVERGLSSSLDTKV